MHVLKPNLCVLGAGSGGLTVAAGASRMGASVVLLEPGEMGGDCLNHGCVPSKALLSAAARRPRPDYADAMADVERAVAAIAPNDSQERFESLGVRVIRQAGRFTDERTVEAEDGTRIRARRFVVATGARAAVPPVAGLADLSYLTNETLWQLRERPAHLVVLGGGPIGCEMALAHARLGTTVTVAEMASILPKDDPELVDLLRPLLTAEGIVFHEGAGAVKAEALPAGGIALHLSDGTRLEGSHILVAAGRQANLERLGCEAGGIVVEHGVVKTDARMLTTNPRVYAIGDVAGGPQFTHAAAYEAGVVIKRALFQLPAKADRGLIPWVTYTDPELAHIGQTEAMARAAHGNGIRVLRWPLAENDRAIATGKTDGLIKAVSTPRGHILGASILAPNAGELILPWCLAIQNKLKIGAMAQVVAPYPTLSEISKRAAGSFYSPGLFSDRTRKIVRWLQKLP